MDKMAIIKFISSMIKTDALLLRWLMLNAFIIYIYIYYFVGYSGKVIPVTGRRGL
jgi:hypothetical protein